MPIPMMSREEAEQKVDHLLEEMRKLSHEVDDAMGTSRYADRLIELAILSRQYIRALDELRRAR